MPNDPVFGPDAMNQAFPPKPLKDSVKGSRREQLEAIRDYIANELEVHRCNTCTASKLRTGDQASLILRLQTVLAEIDALGDDKKVNRLASIRAIHTGDGGPPAPAQLPAGEGQRRTGSRRPGGGRHPA